MGHTYAWIPTHDFVMNGAHGLRLAPGEKLELADVGLTCAGKNVQADARGRDCGKLIDLLVSNCFAGCNGMLALFAFVPDLDCVFLDVLAVIDPFHRDGMVEGDGLVEMEFKGRMMRTGRR